MEAGVEKEHFFSVLPARSRRFSYIAARTSHRTTALERRSLWSPIIEGSLHDLLEQGVVLQPVPSADLPAIPPIHNRSDRSERLFPSHGVTGFAVKIRDGGHIPERIAAVSILKVKRFQPNGLLLHILSNPQANVSRQDPAERIPEIDQHDKMQTDPAPKVIQSPGGGATSPLRRLRTSHQNGDLSGRMQRRLISERIKKSRAADRLSQHPAAAQHKDRQ